MQQGDDIGGDGSITHISGPQEAIDELLHEEDTIAQGRVPQIHPPTQGDNSQLPHVTRVGRYLLMEAIGAGAMGSVYAARDPDLDRSIAIKFVRPGQDEARLLREAKALARLSHVNVVPVYDVGTLDGRVFVAMELVEGITLRKWLSEQTRSWREVVERFLDAARGLAAAHAVGLVHRDFKPDNVVVGFDGRVRVLDFGLASRQAEVSVFVADEASALAADSQASTQSGALVGTPAYMAPEQIARTSVDPSADQWSFCVALWEALYGARPFRANTVKDLLAKICSTDLVDTPPHSDVPQWLSALLLRGLKRDPALRHGSMQEIVSLFEDHLADDAGQSRTVGLRYQPLRPAVPHGPFARRALDKLTGRVVTLLKLRGDVLSTPEEQKDSLRTLRMLPSVRHPHVISVLDTFVDDEQVSYLVLDLRGPTEDAITTTRSEPASVQLSRFLQLLQALAYLHWRGIAFGDLSPWVVRVVDGQIKLLLPHAGELERACATGANLCLSDADKLRKDIASDIVGAVTLALRWFGTPDWGEASAVASSLEHVDPRLRTIFADIIAGGVEQETASSLLAKIAAALRKPSADTIDTREAFFQAGRFVGRSAEMRLLSGRLHEASMGRGSAWILSGESGAGRTRFLAELRTVALEQGTLVLAGQEDGDGAVPYRLWREPLRKLVLAVEVSDLEASVLLPIVDDIAVLLGRAVDHAPVLDGAAKPARLEDTVLAILRRAKVAIVITLDDVQLARSDSLRLLARVAEAASAMPILVVAAERSDDHGNLFVAPAGLERVRLERLSREDTAALAESLIPAIVRRSDMLGFFYRESEGNLLLLFEVIRSFAEESGSLEAVVSAAVPKRIDAGGMRRFVQRRLAGVAPHHLPLLRAAALLGGTLELDLIIRVARELSSKPFDCSAWLDELSSASVLRRDDEHWVFAHHKLRDAVLGDIEPRDRKELHAIVARTIAATYPSDDNRAESLALHFRLAGDEEQERKYVAIAGRYALGQGAYGEARVLLERALELAPTAASGDVSVAQLHGMAAEACYALGEYGPALEHLGSAHSVLGWRMPQSVLGWVLLLIQQVIVQIWHLLVRVKAAKPTQRQVLVEVAAVASQLSSLQNQRRDTLQAITAAVLSVNAADSAGITNPRSVGVLGYTVGVLRLHQLARRYFERGRRAGHAQAADGSVALTELLEMEGMYWMGVGSLDRADEVFTQGLDVSSRLGYGLGKGHADGLLGMSDYFRGHFHGTLDHFDLALSHLQEQTNRHHPGLLCGRALALEAMGRFGEARELLDRARVEVASDDHLTRSFVASQTALIAVGQGHADDAVAAAKEALALMGSFRRVPACSPQVLLGPALALIAGWKAAVASGGPELDKIRSLARHHGATLRAWSRLYPIAEPISSLVSAQIASLEGRPHAARKRLGKALRDSRKMSLGYVEALTLLELSQHAALEPGGDRALLQQAEQAFAKCGVDPALFASLRKSRLSAHDISA